MLSSQADGSVVIDTTIDTEELKKGIDQANKTVDDFVKKTGSGFSTIDKDIDSTSKRAQKLKIEPTVEGISNAEKELAHLEAKLAAQERLFEDTNKAMIKTSEKYGEYSTQVLNATKRTIAAEDAVYKTTTAVEKLRKNIDDAKAAMAANEKAAEEAAKANEAAMAAEAEAAEKAAQAYEGLTEDIQNTEDAMAEGASSAGEYSGKLEDTKGASEKASEGSKTLQTALGDLISKGIQKALSSLVDLIDKTKEFRGDMSKLEQNARDSGVSLGTTDEAMRRLYAVTGETDSSVEALSNLLASGFNDNTMLDAVEALEGAVVRFPDTIKIESLADNLQETLATKEATGAFAEVLGRVGINVEDYNKKIGKMSESAARNYTMSLLQKAGLADTAKEWEANNKQMVEANKAAYDLQKTQADLGAAMEPLRTQILQQVTELLDDNKETIEALITTVGKVMGVIIDVIGTLLEYPGVMIVVAAAIAAVALALLTAGTNGRIAGAGMAAAAKQMARAAPQALSAGAAFAQLALEITAVGIAIAAVITSIALLISAIRGVPAIAINSNLTGQPKTRGYARGTLSARRGLALVGEQGPELINFGGGERVYNATQTAAMRAIASPGGGSYQDNRQYIFKVDDIATYAAIERRMQGERQSRRMGYVGAY